MYRDNRAKAKLLAGEPVYGVWHNTADTLTAELLGTVGYDAVLFDHEHGAASIADGVRCFQAIAGTTATALVRVPSNDRVYLKRVLDAGAEGVMVPAIGSAEEATEAVRACRYPPAGIRGAAYGIARASSFGLSPDDYLATVEERLLVILQIETVEGVEAIPDIARVEGVDVLFVGPWDLSGSIGRLGRFDDPDVRALVRRAERAILDSGRILGSICSLGRSAAGMVADGVRLVIGPTDLGLLRDAAAADLTAFRAEIAASRGRHGR